MSGAGCCVSWRKRALSSPAERPLRERGADLPILVANFLREFAPPGRQAMTLEPAAWAALSRYPFPGNVRELKHAIQHGTVLAQGNSIRLEHLPEDVRGEAASERNPQGNQPLPIMIEQYEKEIIERTLGQASGERMKTAKLLGISRKSLWKKMSKYGLH
jgi:transcriptional regulator with PAS, ATPase and Fis domain